MDEGQWKPKNPYPNPNPKQALTAGFMCIVACEANGAAEPSAVAMDDLR